MGVITAGVVLGITSIIGAALQMAQVGINATSEVKAALKDQKLRPFINELQKKISEDSNLREKLYDAYVHKDNELMNSIVLSSPLSSAYKHLLKERTLVKDQYEKGRKELDRTINENTAKLNAAHLELGQKGSNIVADNKSKSATEELIKGGIS